MPSESKTCQNCKQSFTIEPDDFAFYEKIKVPPPTFCPECRLIRRMTWRNERSLFKRNCAKTGKEIITMFHPDEAVTVYDREVWWSDEWDAGSYGQDYDFDRPFFQQFRELLEKVPLANLANDNCVDSPYGNNNADCKDCYLTYASFSNERVNYSFGAVHMKDCIDDYVCMNSEFSAYDSVCGGLYKTHFSYDSDESLNSFFLKSSINLQDCVGCINLRNKSKNIFNTQYTKEEYEEKRKEFNFGSYKTLVKFEEEYKKFILGYPNRYASILKSQDVTGDMVMNAKNAQKCFDIYGGVEDSKYLIHIVDMKDSYDVYGGGAGANLMYEGVDAGIQASNQLFSVFAHSNLDTKYTYMCFGSKNLFGCIGLRKKEYCILNKQYTKEEYEALVPKIIEQMNSIPYIDQKGNEYKYGEFFPSSISPFAYNETIAQEYFPKTKEDIQKNDLVYRASPEKYYKVTIDSTNLPDDISDVPDSVVDEVIACPHGGNELTQCTKAYRIIGPELEFLRQNNLALPRYCPNCRHYKRLAQRNPFKLWKRKCQCAGDHSENNKYKNSVVHTHGAGACSNEFETSYSPERLEIVYCEKCYQQEVI
ncbi:MAG: hypothetical protein WCK91_02570 [bacterium]